MIYTSYFDKAKELKLYSKRDYLCIAICRKNPEVYCGASIKELAPSLELLHAYKKGEIDTDYYTEKYNEEVLKGLSEKMILDLIYEKIPEDIKGILANEKYCFAEESSELKVVLLCYEPEGEFCHRHLLAEYLRNQLQIECREL